MSSAAAAEEKEVDEGWQCLLCCSKDVLSVQGKSKQLAQQKISVAVVPCAHSGQFCGTCVLRLACQDDKTHNEQIRKLSPSKRNPKKGSQQQHIRREPLKCPYCYTEWRKVTIAHASADKQQPEVISPLQLDLDSKNAANRPIAGNALVPAKYNIKFGSELVKQFYLARLSVYCTLCEEKNGGKDGERAPWFVSLTGLQKHLKSVHKVSMCTACMESRDVFINQRRFYTHDELTAHYSKGTPARGGEGPIPKHHHCKFCNIPLYSFDALYSHYLTHHLSCALCSTTTKELFCRNRSKLLAHYHNKHFCCPHCDTGNRAGGDVVFASEDMLQYHIDKVHLTHNSSLESLEARMMQGLFAHQDDGKGRGRGQGRGRGNANSSHEVELDLVNGDTEESLMQQPQVAAAFDYHRSLLLARKMSEEGAAAARNGAPSSLSSSSKVIVPRGGNWGGSRNSMRINGRSTANPEMAAAYPSLPTTGKVDLSARGRNPHADSWGGGNMTISGGRSQGSFPQQQQRRQQQRQAKRIPRHMLSMDPADDEEGEGGDSSPAPSLSMDAVWQQAADEKTRSKKKKNKHGNPSSSSWTTSQTTSSSSSSSAQPVWPGLPGAAAPLTFPNACDPADKAAVNTEVMDFIAMVLVGDATLAMLKTMSAAFMTGKITAKQFYRGILHKVFDSPDIVSVAEQKTHCDGIFTKFCSLIPNDQARRDLFNVYRDATAASIVQRLREHQRAASTNLVKLNANGSSFPTDTASQQVERRAAASNNNAAFDVRVKSSSSSSSCCSSSSSFREEIEQVIDPFATKRRSGSECKPRVVTAAEQEGLDLIAKVKAQIAARKAKKDNDEEQEAAAQVAAVDKKQRARPRKTGWTSTTNGSKSLKAEPIPAPAPAPLMTSAAARMEPTPTPHAQTQSGALQLNRDSRLATWDSKSKGKKKKKKPVELGEAQDASAGQPQPSQESTAALLSQLSLLDAAPKDKADLELLANLLTNTTAWLLAQSTLVCFMAPFKYNDLCEGLRKLKLMDVLGFKPNNWQVCFVRADLVKKLQDMAVNYRRFGVDYAVRSLQSIKGSCSRQELYIIYLYLRKALEKFTCLDPVHPTIQEHWSRHAQLARGRGEVSSSSSVNSAQQSKKKKKKGGRKQTMFI
jgi:hypothetical protein